MNVLASRRVNRSIGPVVVACFVVLGGALFSTRLGESVGSSAQATAVAQSWLSTPVIRAGLDGTLYLSDAPAYRSYDGGESWLPLGNPTGQARLIVPSLRHAATVLSIEGAASPGSVVIRRSRDSW